jgi:hypothetical protein
MSNFKKIGAGILIWFFGFVCGAIGQDIYLWAKDLIWHPEIVINVTKIEPLVIGEGQKEENFKLLFKTKNEKGMLVVAKTGNETLNAKYGVSHIPFPVYKMIDPNFNKNEYSISFKNIGNEVASSISFDLNSKEEIIIPENEISPNVKLKHCGYYPQNNCHLEITNLSPGQESSFTALGLLDNENDFTLRIDGKERDDIDKNLREFKIQIYSDALENVMLSGNKLEFPPLSGEEKDYYYQIKENKWIEY